MTPPFFSIAIVAHPKRARMAHDLLIELQTKYRINATLVWDTHSDGAETNHLRAWDWLAGESTTWGVVLEDDVILCDRFFWQLQDALTLAHADVVSLYLGRGRPPHRQQDIAVAIGSRGDASFIVAKELLSGQGYAMRTHLFSRRSGVRKHTHPRTDKIPKLPIDEAITKWLSETRQAHIDVAYPIPSLIDHRDGPTLVTHWDEADRDGKTALMADDCDPTGADLPEVRKAWWFGAHNQWTSTSIRLGKQFTEGDT